MKKVIVVLACAFLCYCTENRKESQKVENQDQRIETNKQNFIEALWKFHPNWASSVGYHKYDSVLSIPDENRRSKEFAFTKANMDSLAQFDINLLSDNNKTDFHLLEDYFRSTNWAITI